MTCTGYKITDKDIRTHNGYQWAVGKWHKAIGNGNDQCTDGVLHYYESPLLAVLLNPIHGNYSEIRLW